MKAPAIAMTALLALAFGVQVGAAPQADPDPDVARPVALVLPDDVETIAGGAPVQLIVDDGVGETSIGDVGQFVWLNRFTPDPAEFPFQLEEIQVVFGATSVMVGGAVDLVVYEDADVDGDPGTGAVHLATYSDVVQVADNATFSVYSLVPPVTLNGPGDVLIGVINRYGMEGLNDFPARIDTTASQGRSWVGSYLAGDAPNPPPFPADEQWGTIDSFGFPGNWVVRGFGTTVPETIGIPTMSRVGLVLLVVLLAGSAWLFLRRRRAVS